MMGYMVAMRRRFLAISMSLLICITPLGAQELPEYQIKAAFLYNFIAFTEWPALLGNSIHLCVYGTNPFGEHLNKLQGKGVDQRFLNVRHTGSAHELQNCQVVFITREVVSNLSRVIDQLGEKPVMLVADVPGTARQGAMLNFVVEEGRVQFEVNVRTAEAKGLSFSSKMLRLAREVYR